MPEYKGIYHGIIDQINKFQTPEDVYVEMEKRYTSDHVGLFVNFLGARQYYLKLVVLAMVKAPYFDDYGNDLLKYYVEGDTQRAVLQKAIKQLKEVWLRAEVKMGSRPFAEYMPLFGHR